MEVPSSSRGRYIALNHQSQKINEDQCQLHRRSPFRVLITLVLARSKTTALKYFVTIQDTSALPLKLLGRIANA
jgi:hypothetical protein